MRPTTNVAVALLLAAVLGRAGVAQSAPHDGYLTTTDGARIHYRITGNGPDTVFLLHGGPGFDQIFSSLISRRWRLITSSSCTTSAAAACRPSPEIRLGSRRSGSSRIS